MPPRRGAGGKDCYLHVNAPLLASLCVAAARAGAVSRVTRPRDRHAVISRSWPQQSDCPGGGELCRSGVGTAETSGMDELQKLCRTKTNKKWCAAHTPATVSTPDQRVETRCHDAGHGVHLASGAAGLVLCGSQDLYHHHHRPAAARPRVAQVWV